MKTLFITIFLFGITGVAQGQEDSNLTTDDVYKIVTGILNEKSGKTEIGRIMMRDSAFVYDKYANNFSLNLLKGYGGKEKIRDGTGAPQIRLKLMLVMFITQAM